MSSWHSYPSIYNTGHRALETLFDGPVVIEEKVDGSQFSFGKFDGEIMVRSKGRVFPTDAPEGMFVKAVESVLERADMLNDGWTYRGEYLQKPSHNTLKYGRVPNGHIILFDINTAQEAYLPPDEKRAEAMRLNLECVPCYRFGEFHGAEALDMLKGFLETESCLGGVKVEGVVVKNYGQFGPDKKALMGKHVSEAFKEQHGAAWSKSNPQRGDIVDLLVSGFRTDARFRKAVQSLRDDGRLAGGPQDIGNLIKAVQADIEKECREVVADALLAWAMPQIKRRVSAGLPEWYKGQLLESQFAEDPR